MKLTSPNNEPDQEFAAKAAQPDGTPSQPLVPSPPTSEESSEAAVSPDTQVVAVEVVAEPEPETALAQPLAPAPTLAPAQPFSWASFALDAFLVLLTAGTVATGAVYLHNTLTEYHIPNPIEIEQNKAKELFERIQTLQTLAYDADEQTRLKQQLASLRKQQAELAQQRDAAQQKREQNQTSIIAQQRAILAANKEAKRLARQQISSGLRIGTIGTLDGRTFHDALIRRIVNKKLIISHSGGQSPVEIDRFSPGALPRLVRFALGMEEILDTKDLVPENSQANSAAQNDAANSVRHANLSLPKSAPIIDTKPMAPSQATPAATNSGPRWIAPTDPLSL